MVSATGRLGYGEESCQHSHRPSSRTWQPSGWGDWQPSIVWACRRTTLGFRYNPDLDTIDISGRDLANTQKFHNVVNNPRVSLVVDDIASMTPWTVRGVEIRGLAEAARLEREPGSSLSPDVIRIRPTRVVSWNV